MVKLSTEVSVGQCVTCVIFMYAGQRMNCELSKSALFIAVGNERQWVFAINWLILTNFPVDDRRMN